MKLAVFGATGTTGSALVGKALGAGHELRVLARTPSKVTSTDHRLTVTQGNAKDPATIGTAPMIANGCGQSALGVLRTCTTSSIRLEVLESDHGKYQR